MAVSGSDSISSLIVPATEPTSAPTPQPAPPAPAGLDPVEDPLALAAEAELGLASAPAPPAAPVRSAPEPTTELPPPFDPLEEAATVIDGLIGGFTEGGELEILFDEETDRFVYQVIDSDTSEVLRQFPPEELLRVVRAIRDVEGLVLDETA
ncbi:MAG: flagellar protein FlaG [Rhodothalassiaceae bacterium]